MGRKGRKLGCGEEAVDGKRLKKAGFPVVHRRIGIHGGHGWKFEEHQG
jgi:hypothetical protein